MPYPFQSQIEAAAFDASLAPDLVRAVVQVESSYAADAWNPEPRYRYFWNVQTNTPFRAVTVDELRSEFPPFDFPSLGGDRDQEWWAQQCSWGLMQVMGAVAREQGYTGTYLTRLILDPALSLMYGCRVLGANLKWSEGNLASALAAYNGGRLGNSPADQPLRSQAYADKVMAVLLKFRH